MKEEKRYIAYRRVSTQRQGESGLGLDGQVPVIEHFTHDGVVIADFVEVQSAKNTNRPILKKAIMLAKSENAILIVAKADRLSRDVRDALEILDDIGEANLVCCDCPSTDRFTLTIIFAVAERERFLISIRTKAALAQKRKRIEQGIDKAYKSGRPKGFKHSEETKAKMRGSASNNRGLDPRMTNAAKRMRGDGKTYAEIAQALNDDGHTAPKGGKILPAHIGRFLK